METDSLRYDKWVEEALRGVIRRALEQTATLGLPGEHHFFVTFQTADEGVEIPASLRAEHPEEMTIVLQHQFDNLVVEPDRFALTLSFSGRPTRLVIPFAAVTSFADPSVSFGLQLKMAPAGEDGREQEQYTQGQENDDARTATPPQRASNTYRLRDADDANAGKADDSAEDRQQPDKMGEIIALDAFRKK